MVFKVALCRECGQHYIVGKVQDGVLQEAIRDPGYPEFGATFFRPLEQMVPEVAVESDEDSTDEAQLFCLCVRCGAIARHRGGRNETGCGHSQLILVEKQKGAEEREDQVPRCNACGYRAPDPVREVVHGTDGSHAVIATTLCQNLPAKRRKVLAFADGRPRGWQARGA